ncbi:hypothetical protein AMQ84_27205 [Paenibacillus riograndensis]|uniref:Uncharacterized protein n=1 Tax=Paenibacillus riograndensis TaxID=483937 RepID=A0A132TJX9_9BACL|nr:hypothetical protein [Paenibacillus riograndensis]KWX71612.1 hypothetical protein AMQ84_27205 [Paenibacillus riograndensis]
MVSIISGTIKVEDIERYKGKIQVTAKQYIMALAESIRESVDPVTGVLNIDGDIAKQIADGLQEIGERMK